MILILTFASLFAAAIPMLFFLYIVWTVDLYTRKPLWLIGGAFLWGASGAVILAIIGQVILDPLLSMFITDQDILQQVSIAIGAPLTEEPAKALILFFLMRSMKFGNICDGFIFGAAAGLGFGMTENAKYFIEGAMGHQGNVDAWMDLVITRTLFSAIMHGLATSLMGAALGLGKFHSSRSRFIIAGVGMLLAMGVHALWNGILVTKSKPGENFLRLAEIFQVQGGDEPLLYSGFFFIVELLCVLFVFVCCTLWEHHRLKKGLTFEAEQGRIDPKHVDYLVSFRKRRGEDWLDSRIPRLEYIKLTTQLALRGIQSRVLNDRRKEWYLSDYKRLQVEVADIQSIS